MTTTTTTTTTNLRALGRVGLDMFVAQHGTGPSQALDQLCGQIHAHTTLLYWFTDLAAALVEARRTKRPVLSLRLLGRLDQELSCANSRFFRRLLYPEPRINQLLRDKFVLHWQSVRPVPVVTIDFGDGRTLQRTLTGNSLHVVLDGHGRPVDALPGLVAPDVFVAQLQRAHGMAFASRDRLAVLHERAGRTPVQPPADTRATRASQIAPTKHMVEGPTLRGVAPIGNDLDGDTRTNLQLHARIHEAFATGVTWSADELVDWVYQYLFLMPPHDPALGLDVAEPFRDFTYA